MKWSHAVTSRVGSPGQIINSELECCCKLPDALFPFVIFIDYSRTVITRHLLFLVIPSQLFPPLYLLVQQYRREGSVRWLLLKLSLRVLHNRVSS